MLNLEMYPMQSLAPEVGGASFTRYSLVRAFEEWFTLRPEPLDRPGTGTVQYDDAESPAAGATYWVTTFQELNPWSSKLF